MHFLWYPLKNKQTQNFLILIEACGSLDRLSRTKTKKGAANVYSKKAFLKWQKIKTLGKRDRAYFATGYSVMVTFSSEHWQHRVGAPTAPEVMQSPHLLWGQCFQVQEPPWVISIGDTWCHCFVIFGGITTKGCSVWQQFQGFQDCAPGTIPQQTGSWAEAKGKLWQWLRGFPLCNVKQSHACPLPHFPEGCHTPVPGM